MESETGATVATEPTLAANVAGLAPTPINPAAEVAAPRATGHADSLPATVNPAGLTVEQLARLLTAAGGRAVAEATIRRHVEAGAPTLVDGRLNLAHYVAWLVREVSVGEE